MIVDVEGTRSIRQAELGAMQTMVDRVEETFALEPERMIADTAYGTGALLEWLIKERGIAPHIPVVDKSGRDDHIFERADFTFDAENNLYICPAGKELKQFHRTYKTPRSGVDRHGIMRYRARKTDCDACELKVRCCPTQPQRKVTRSIHEPSRNVARAIAQPPQYAISCKLRKKVEMLFAHLKRILGLGRLRLRGPCGARDEFHLAATAQNLRKLAKFIPAQTSSRAA